MDRISLLALRHRLADAMRLDSFSAREIARTMASLIEEGSRFQASQQALFDTPVTTAASYRRTAAALSLAGLQSLSVAATVTMPSLGAALCCFLNLDAVVRPTTWTNVFLPAGHRLAPDTAVPLPTAAVAPTEQPAVRAS